MEDATTGTVRRDRVALPPLESSPAQSRNRRKPVLGANHACSYAIRRALVERAEEAQTITGVFNCLIMTKKAAWVRGSE